MISPQRLELFNESSLPEAITLHANQPGFFSLLVLRAASNPKQRSYRVDLLPPGVGRHSFDPQLLHIPSDIL